MQYITFYSVPNIPSSRYRSRDWTNVMFSSCVRIVTPVLRRRSSSSTNVRKSTDIKSLFKKIHPDLFATRSHDVQQTNLKCMQAIQELNNQIQHTIELVGSHQKNCRSGDSQVLIGYPRSFHPVYRLSCYVQLRYPFGNTNVKRLLDCKLHLFPSQPR